MSSGDTFIGEATKTAGQSRIRNRLVLIFTVLLVGAMGVAMSTLLVQRVSDIKTRLIDETIVRAKTVATQVAPSLEFGEPREAQTLLEHFAADPVVRAARITDGFGEHFASYGELSIPDGYSRGATHFINSAGLWVVVPVMVDSVSAGNLSLQIGLDEMRGEIRRSLVANLLVILAVIALTSVLSLKAVRIIIDPISSLAGTAAKITENGDYSLRAEKHADDEIGLLTDHFNRMLATIEEQNKTLEEQHERLARSDRLESLGLLAGGVAHDLNNILGPLVSMPELILKDLPDSDPIRGDIEMMGKASQRAAVVIQDLLSLARSGVYKLQRVSLTEVVNDCIGSPAVEQRLKEAPGVSCKVELQDAEQYVKGSEPHLVQAILNLAINAIEAMGQSGSGGTLTLKAEAVAVDTTLKAYETIPPGDYMMLEVKDQGPGLAAEDVKRIFEPFYTSKKMGASGSGLGLSVVYGVVHDHGGFLDVVSEPGKGATFRLYLQQSNEEDNVKELERPTDSEPVTTEARILVIDDYDLQRSITEKLLKSLGHRTESAVNGRQAISILQEDSAFDLMVVDMIMDDDFDGLDTIRGALEINPDLRCVIATGFSETDRVESALELGASACLNKPYTVDTLSKAVSNALDDGVALHG